MKKVPTASHDYLVSIIIFLTVVFNVFMKNKTYPLMFIGSVYNTPSKNKFLYSFSIEIFWLSF